MASKRDFNNSFLCWNFIAPNRTRLRGSEIEALTPYVIQLSLMMLMVTVFEPKANCRCSLDFFSWISSYSYRNTYHRKNIPSQSLTKFPVDGQVQWCLAIMAMTAIKIRSRCRARGNRNPNKERKN